MILDQMGIYNLGFKQSNYKSSALGAVISFLGITKGLLTLPKRSTLVMQYPLSKFYGYKTKWAKAKGCKIILIVHDVKTLMGKNKEVAKEMILFNKADVLVVHNKAMLSWFKANGFKGELVSNYLFDYLLKPDQRLPVLPTAKGTKIVFAGGLGMEKSAFLYKLNALKEPGFKLELYGGGFQKQKVEKKSILNYYGSFAPDEVLNHLKGNFGLVWNGNAVNRCDGAFGNYVQFNNPHKTSLYLLAGLPLIIWKKAAVAKLVEEEGIGFTIESLEELSQKIAAISESDYQKMLTKVAVTREKIAQGHFLETAMGKALQLV